MRAKKSFINRIVDSQSNLMSFAYQLTLDKESARDLVQDTTLKALSNEDKYVENVNFKGWIMTIMRNIFINNYRRNLKENKLIDVSQDLYSLNVFQEDDVNTPYGSIAVSEITKIISSFPKEFSQPFNMYVAGYKYEEIAKELNLPRGTVKSRIFAIRHRLRYILADYK